jgi:urease accessory protein
MTTDAIASLAALHLASPALPVGGFSYSQGLESAHALGVVQDERSVGQWIQACREQVFERSEAPAWILQYRAWANLDGEAARRWNDWFLCARETLEMRQETEQMGWSMARLIESLQLGSGQARDELLAIVPIGYPAASAFAFVARGVGEELGLLAYAFAWLENQVAAALKTIPLGQLAGQRLLTGLMADLPTLVERAQSRALNAPRTLETFAPQFAILSARHENQYSRLFRS